MRLLALALVPWTVLMALAQPRWFPSRWAHIGWVAFDAALAAVLLALAARFRGWLAATVTADALVTLAQIVLWDGPRADRAADWIAMAAGIIGPSLGAFVLWAAVGHCAHRPAPPSIGPRS